MLEELLSERMLYYEIDLVIYLEVPQRDYLKEFTNELDRDDYIVEFVSGGPRIMGTIPQRAKWDANSVLPSPP